TVSDPMDGYYAVTYLGIAGFAWGGFLGPPGVDAGLMVPDARIFVEAPPSDARPRPDAPPPADAGPPGDGPDAAPEADAGEVSTISVHWIQPADGEAVSGDVFFTLQGEGFRNVEFFRNGQFFARCDVNAEGTIATATIHTTLFGDGPFTLTAHA